MIMFGSGEKVYIRVYSSNSKGRSTPVILKAETSLAAGVRKYFCFVLEEIFKGVGSSRSFCLSEDKEDNPRTY